MKIPTNSIDGDSSGNPLLDVADHAVHFGIGGGIQTMSNQYQRRANIEW